MLVTAAAAFHFRGLDPVASIETAYLTLENVLGPLSKYLFGIGLLASGLSSSAVGTLSGQIIYWTFFAVAFRSGSVGSLR